MLRFKLDINNKLVIGFIIVAVLLSFILINRLTGPKSYVFGGEIVKIEGSTIFIEGLYMQKSGEEYAILPTKANTQKRQIKAIITPQTEFIKISFNIPDLKEGQVFRPSEFPKQVLTGSFEEVERERPAIFTTSDKNIFGKKSFKVKKVEYTIPIFPR